MTTEATIPDIDNLTDEEAAQALISLVTSMVTVVEASTQLVRDIAQDPDTPEFFGQRPDLFIGVLALGAALSDVRRVQESIGE